MALLSPAALQAKIEKLQTNMERLNSIVNGSDTTDVVIDSGTVPSIAKLFDMLSGQAAAILAASVGAASRVASLNGVRLSASPDFPLTTTDHASVKEVYAVPYTGQYSGVWDATNLVWESLKVSSDPIKLTVDEDVTLTSGSNSITGVVQWDSILPGMIVYGTNIPGGTTVTSSSAGTVTLSNNAAGSGVRRLTFKLPASTTYDIVLSKTSAGNCRPRLNATWSDAWNRSVNYTLIDGVPVLSSNNNLKYIGSIRTGPIEGTTIDTSRERLIFNMYNQCPRRLLAACSIDSYALAVQDWRVGGGQDPRNSVTILVGWQTTIEIEARSFAKSSSADKWVGVGIGVNSPINPLPWRLDSALSQVPGYIAGANGYAAGIAKWVGDPGVGVNTFTWLESGYATNDLTFYGQGGNLGARENYFIQAGLIGQVTM